jgi:hypothetical protein
MINTPMTSREAFEEYYKRTENPDADFTRYAPDSFAYKDDAIDELWYPWDDAWECCQAQQASVIAELESKLANIVVTDNTSVIAQQAQTIAELVEALEVITPIYHQLAWVAVCWNDHNFDDKAIYKKVNTAFTEAGFSRGDGVEPVNDFVEKLEALIAKAKGQ